MSSNVAVIGAGVLGLCTGICLVEAGHRVTIYTKSLVAQNVSAAAGAMFLPIWAESPENSGVSRVPGWAIQTWQVLKKQVNTGCGVEWMRATEMFRKRTVPPDYLRSCLVDIECADDENLPADFKFRWSFTTIMIEPKRYLDCMLQKFTELGGKIETHTLMNTQDAVNLPEPIVVNCAGLGSGDLFHDSALQPVKGQLVLLRPTALPSIIGAGEFVVLPRPDALVLGSLFMESYETEEPTLHHTELLWNTISAWTLPESNIGIGLPHGTLDRNQIIGTVACLRPYRHHGPRVEAEIIQSKKIIHNYGHGGSGYTLGWGCAKTVVDMI